MTESIPPRPPARLDSDDPEWPMPQPAAGPTTPRTIPRRLRVYVAHDGTHLAIVTERGPGMSITNVAGEVHAALSQQYPGPGPLRVFEHYPPRGREEEDFAEIVVEPGGRTNFRPMTRDQMIVWCGAGVLDDMPELPPDPTRDDNHPADQPRPPAPDGPGIDDSTVIHGYASTTGALVMLETPAGDVLGPLVHHVKHSTDGLTWGYYGSGCAELARCILIAVLGADARCHTCNGVGYLVDVDQEDTEPYDAARHRAGDTFTCWDCDRGINLSPALYQAYKEDAVATWPEPGFSTTGAQVRTWLANHQSDPKDGRA